MRWLLVLGVAACGTSDEPFDSSVTPTITSGIYGQCAAPSDTGGPTHAIVGRTVTASVDATVIASSTTDDRGVFELQLDAGTYVLAVDSCVPNSYPTSCITTTTVEAAPVREDCSLGLFGIVWGY